MEKTIKQIADELSIDKQRVYRYIKRNCISEAHQKNGVMYYDEAVERRIKQEFLQGEVHQRSASRSTSNDALEAVIEVLREQTEMLKKELDEKNKQIDSLNAALLASQERLKESHVLIDQQQKLQVVSESRLQLIEDKVADPDPVEEPKKKHWWQIFKKKG